MEISLFYLVHSIIDRNKSGHINYHYYIYLQETHITQIELNQVVFKTRVPY
jgi:hypothetical protein